MGTRKLQQVHYPFLIISLEGTITLSTSDRKRLQHPAVAGVILFHQQDGPTAQIQELIHTIKAINNEIVIMIDQEGGSVKRFSYSAPMLGSHYDLAQLDQPQCYDQIAQTAAYLKEIGVDLNLGPILDIHSLACPIIGERNRAFSEDPMIIEKYASIWIQAHQDYGVMCSGKHFPGHGLAEIDSHLGRVEDKRCLEELEALDIKPYQALVSQLDSVMLAHITYSTIDRVIVPHSRFWIDYLRNKLNYKGIVISDCLTMKGISGTIEEKVTGALRAGCDWMFICHDYTAMDQILSLDYTVDSHLALSRIKSLS